MDFIINGFSRDDWTFSTVLDEGGRRCARWIDVKLNRIGGRPKLLCYRLNFKPLNPDVFTRLRIERFIRKGWILPLPDNGTRYVMSTAGRKARTEWVAEVMIPDPAPRPYSMLRQVQSEVGPLKVLFVAPDGAMVYSTGWDRVTTPRSFSNTPSEAGEVLKLNGVRFTGWVKLRREPSGEWKVGADRFNRIDGKWGLPDRPRERMHEVAIKAVTALASEDHMVKTAMWGFDPAVRRSELERSVANWEQQLAELKGEHAMLRMWAETEVGSTI